MLQRKVITELGGRRRQQEAGRGKDIVGFSSFLSFLVCHLVVLRSPSTKEMDGDKSSIPVLAALHHIHACVVGMALLKAVLFLLSP